MSERRLWSRLETLLSQRPTHGGKLEDELLRAGSTLGIPASVIAERLRRPAEQVRRHRRILVGVPPVPFTADEDAAIIPARSTAATSTRSRATSAGRPGLCGCARRSSACTIRGHGRAKRPHEDAAVRERSGGDVFATTVRFATERRDVDVSAKPAHARTRGTRATRPNRVAGRDEVQARARVPRHVGIITDGNRRWARLNGIAIATGHRRGARLLRDITTEFLAQGIAFVSVYLFSTENWTRDPHEINDLMDIFVEFARDNVDFLDANQICVRSLGQHQQLPGFPREALDYVERRTAANDRLTLGLCLNYGGQAELVDAIRAMIASGMPAEEVSAHSVAEFLYAPDIPPLDLIIRTGGQQRLSNFMLWRAAYAELAFVDNMWPAFTAADLQRILKDYSDRVRRFGG